MKCVDEGVKEGKLAPWALIDLIDGLGLVASL